MAKRSEIDSLIKEAIERRDKLVEALGGTEIVKRQKDLVKALLIDYKDKGETIEERIGYALTEYRDKIAMYGYKLLRPEMVPIVETYGTIKDKAALCCIGYFDLTRENKVEIGTKAEPVLDRKRVDEIRKKIRRMGKGAIVEYMNYLSLYNCFMEIFHLFYRVKYTYLAIAYQITIYFNTYEWLTKTGELFNAIEPHINDKELTKIATDFNEYLQNYQRFGELKEVKGEGWQETQAGNCLEYASLLTEIATDRLSALKGHIKGIKSWAAENEALIFMPMEMREQIEDVEEGYIKELHSKYYKNYIKERGELSTEEERKAAIYPSYDETKANEEMITFTIKKLNGYKKEFK